MSGTPNNDDRFCHGTLGGVIDLLVVVAQIVGWALIPLLLLSINYRVGKLVRFHLHGETEPPRTGWRKMGRAVGRTHGGPPTGE